MNRLKTARSLHVGRALQRVGMFALLISGLFSLFATPAFAHHAMGGRMPSNFFEGFLTGVAHPLIGPDHVAMIVAVGLLAAIKRQGILIPVAFVLAAMVGTGAHLAKLSVPGLELFVSASVLVFGLLLVMKESPKLGVVAGLAAIAGLFHGYAYGEAIFGAEATPLFAYLAGFTVIQLVVSLAAFGLGKGVLRRQTTDVKLAATFRSAGLVICGMGLAFFTSQAIALLFPLPHA